MKPLDDLDDQEKNEESTKLNYITPAIQRKWCGEGDRIVMEYGDKKDGFYFTDGQISVDDEGNSSRGKRKKVDYLLLIKNNLPLALVEAKGYDHEISEGIQQSLEYAQMLDVPFAYSSNGQGFHEEDIQKGTNRDFSMDDFPTSDELWERYKENNNIEKEQEDIILTPYYNSGDGRKPRYYQRIAINRTIKAIAEGQKKMLLVMATGTGKTFVAMQIIHRLYRAGLKKKILFLVDRNALANQTFDSFTPFKKSMCIIGSKNCSLKKKEDIDNLAAHEVFISLYHQMKSGTEDDIEDEEDIIENNNEGIGNDYYKNLPPDFFDLIIVDECHRGSLNEESGWHEMLKYFSAATQIGLTATPKETSFGSNINYFCEENGGKPLYTYSLQQGIKDGFLAPYKLVTYNLDIDQDGYRPKEGELDIHGNPLEDRIYEQKEFDKKIIIDSRRQEVARIISDYLKQTDRFMKTILFCETEEHAGAMMNYLKNENSDLVAEDYRYVTRITASDKVGKDQIKNFAAPNEKYPVIAVTSKLLSTGVDTQTVGLIVLDKTIGSMTEFKQTIGRGTRIKENYRVGDEEKSKMSFAIIDFRKNYLKFEDPDFDGPVEVVPGGSKPCKPSKPHTTKPLIYHINGGDIQVLNNEVRYLDEQGHLVKECNIKSCINNNILETYSTFEEFKKAWSEASDKVTFAKELLINDTFVKKMWDELDEHADYYDLISFIGYDIDIPDKEDRISKIKKCVENLDEEKRKIIDILMICYKETDFYDLKSITIFDLPIFYRNNYTRMSAVNVFGSKEGYLKIMNEIENILY